MCVSVCRSEKEYKWESRWEEEKKIQAVAGWDAERDESGGRDFCFWREAKSPRCYGLVCGLVNLSRSEWVRPRPPHPTIFTPLSDTPTIPLASILPWNTANRFSFWPVSLKASPLLPQTRPPSPFHPALIPPGPFRIQVGKEQAPEGFTARGHLMDLSRLLPLCYRH